MAPSIVVLANPTAASERAARYAALLSAPINAHLTLLNLLALNNYPVMLTPELADMETREAQLEHNERMGALWAMAESLPAPAEVEEAPGPMFDAVTTAVRRHMPVLLGMGLSAQRDLFDHILHNQALPVLRATRLPLLLVPEAAPDPALPHRVLVALDSELFTPSPAARRLAPLLAAWPAAFTVTNVAESKESRGFSGQLSLAEMQASQLLPANAPIALFETSDKPPTEGILQACAETHADLLVLIARPRSFLGNLFHRSVTADVLRHTRVPVLLVPAEQ
jgi:nucleotide-binding universal stress UspA family protein